MPTESTRKVSIKRIFNPSGAEQFVDIPVIDQITFIDPYDRYQETVFTFSNDENGDRTIHIDRVYNSGDSSQFVDVERIDLFKTVDPYERYQEHHFAPDNKTGADTTPPSFISHLKTHIKRIYGTGGNASCWVDTERIDQIKFTDPYDRYQEKIYTLNKWDDET